MNSRLRLTLLVGHLIERFFDGLLLRGEAVHHCLFAHHFFFRRLAAARLTGHHALHLIVQLLLLLCKLIDLIDKLLERTTTTRLTAGTGHIAIFAGGTRAIVAIFALAARAIGTLLAVLRKLLEGLLKCARGFVERCHRRLRVLLRTLLIAVRHRIFRLLHFCKGFTHFAAHFRSNFRRFLRKFHRLGGGLA